MDGIAAAIKAAVKDTISYHPEAVIRNTEQLMHYLHDLNICIATYSNEEVIEIRWMFPQPFSNLTFRSRSGYEIKSVHEIHISFTGDQVIKWKKVSSDAKYDEAKILTSPVSCEIGKDNLEEFLMKINQVMVSFSYYFIMTFCKTFVLLTHNIGYKYALKFWNVVFFKLL